MKTVEYRRMFEAEESQWWYVGMRALAFSVLNRHRYTRGELEALLAKAGLENLRSSYCNTLLLPLLALRRGLDRLSGRDGSDVGFLPAPLERLFRSLLRLEAAWLRRGHGLPLGASVLALARRP